MTTAEAIAYLEPVLKSTPMGRYAEALDLIMQAAKERDAAVTDAEMLLWLYGHCEYCAKGKGKGHRNLDKRCPVCEPKWRGTKKK